MHTSINVFNENNKGKWRDVANNQNKIEQLNLPKTKDGSRQCLSPWRNGWQLEVTPLVCSGTLSMSKFWWLSFFSMAALDVSALQTSEDPLLCQIDIPSSQLNLPPPRQLFPPQPLFTWRWSWWYWQTKGLLGPSAPQGKLKKGKVKAISGPSRT